MQFSIITQSHHNMSPKSSQNELQNNQKLHPILTPSTINPQSRFTQFKKNLNKSPIKTKNIHSSPHITSASFTKQKTNKHTKNKVNKNSRR